LNSVTALRGEHQGENAMAVSKELLDILVCPKCKGDLILTEQQDGLICNACKLRYAIKDDIPVMLIDEAVRIE
jgi:uncharacterized protein YbaR (Trm112 family)